MDMYLRSEGCNDPGVTPCGTTIIQVHGVDHSLHRRGHNIVVVNAKTGKRYSKKSCLLFPFCIIFDNFYSPFLFLIHTKGILGLQFNFIFNGLLNYRLPI